ncbi:MAG: hypothetical protein IJA20_03625 [Methanocorpusculum sp.]|nr:hypothetical protein [Oscillospiraceae bacterium]MBQ3569747.1 hypothetical protein [Methanocorpusculum sp.]
MVPEHECISSLNFDDTLCDCHIQRPTLFELNGQHFFLSSTNVVFQLLSHVCFAATQFKEADGSITLSADTLDIVSHGSNIREAKALFAKDVMEYAEEYYRNFDTYRQSPNRKDHLPYVIKSLCADSLKQLEESIICHF